MRSFLLPLVALIVTAFAVPAAAADPPRPNILWISAEDISPDLGCYGDSYARTPNIDRLAEEGVRFTRAFAHAGVCAPARSGIITGMYPTSIGTNPMRCRGVPQPDVRCFSEYLREAGYYCTNNVKTDYQFNPPISAWDENSNTADWRGREEGQPFFAVINFTSCHESQIRSPRKQTQELVAALPEDRRHDPDEAVVPPYYPNTDVTRRDWANYADVVSAMDTQVAEVLQRLEEDGLADDTIVWFWGDHGRGLPRAKRWIYDSGVHVPLIIRVPEKWRAHANPGNPDAVAPGSTHDELVAFVDFAPTMLSLASIPIPEHLQGQAFLGPSQAEPREYIYAARDRMDEAYDCIRAVRDKRFKYIRNFMPHLSRGQDIAYMNLMPTMQQMRQMHAAGELTGPQLQYFEVPKPVEELYDTEADPHEVNNLADDPAYADTLKRLRGEMERWMRDVNDVGLIPEPLFDAVKHPVENGIGQTGTPGIDVRSSSVPGKMEVVLNGTTPGSRIVWKTNDSGWKLYAMPVLVPIDQQLTVKACRIGFKDSPNVSLKVSGEPIKTLAKPSPHDDVPHWSETIWEDHPLDRLLEVKALDGKTVDAGDVEAYLSDSSAAVRYWALLAVHHQAADETVAALAERITRLRDDDPTWTVRIAAAELLATRVPDALEASLETLSAALDAPQDKERLHAVIAVNHLGPLAKPLHDKVATMIPDGTEYIKNVARNTLE